LTGENGSTLSKTYPNDTLSIRNSSWTGLGLNSGVRSEKPATKQPNPRHGLNFSCSGFLRRIFAPETSFSWVFLLKFTELCYDTL